MTRRVLTPVTITRSLRSRSGRAENYEAVSVDLAPDGRAAVALRAA